MIDDWDENRYGFWKRWICALYGICIGFGKLGPNDFIFEEWMRRMKKSESIFGIERKRFYQCRIAFLTKYLIFQKKSVLLQYLTLKKQTTWKKTLSKSTNSTSVPLGNG